jgi:fibronectin type 3 domain-containing protein
VRDSQVQAGQRYVYSVVAEDSAGNASAPAVATITVRTPAAPPAPRFVSAERRAGGTVIRWERVIADRLAGYLVDRGPSPNGPFTRVTSVAISALSFVDPRGPAGAWYVVRAVDVSGRESVASPPARGAP